MSSSLYAASDRCSRCGLYLGQAAANYIGTSTTTRFICDRCWDKWRAKVKSEKVKRKRGDDDTN